ncbi:MAG: 4Fe-4S binding protein [Ruminococcaceae bacterium]|nr:4Fe-4S binding protein [Oscillospiraceae bacterium]
MKFQKVWVCFFSATGTTRKIAETMARRLAQQGGVPFGAVDFTTPAHRQTPPAFSEGDLVVVGTPVYAGRVPNLILPFVAAIQGNGAMAVPLVVYGNRAYDDALMELRNTLEAGGFRTVAGAAFIGEHSFGRALAAGRPDESDLAMATRFAGQVFSKVEGIENFDNHSPVFVRGNNPVGPYFRPTGPQGQAIDIRKVKPQTAETCNRCLWCVQHCPMGAIDPEDPRQTPGICIKCNACVKGCPQQAKAFDDPNYLFHKDDITARYSAPRKEPECFL